MKLTNKGPNGRAFPIGAKMVDIAVGASVDVNAADWNATKKSRPAVAKCVADGQIIEGEPTNDDAFDAEIEAATAAELAQTVEDTKAAMVAAGAAFKADGSAENKAAVEAAKAAHDEAKAAVKAADKAAKG